MHPNFHDFLDYEPDTGLIRWRVSPTNRVRPGDVAGKIDKDGYIRIGFQGKHYFAHRVAWLMMTGEWPEAVIDHINCHPADNRWSNLRAATISQNSANRRSKRDLPKGATRHKGGRYQVIVGHNRRLHYIGLFDTPEAAHDAYVRASEQFHGEFARAS